MTSCERLKTSTKKTPKPVLSVVLRAGEVAPFNGILVGDEDFKILLKAATRGCER